MADSDSVISRIFRKTSAKIKSSIISNSDRLSVKFHSPSLPDGLLRRFSLSEINAATANFSHASLIGQGGFGSVYRGVIDDGTLPVAVKRFFNSRSNKTQPSSSGFVNSEFRTEALLLCQLRHPHIIRPIGFCCEHGEEILVYEYMANGGLDRHLFNPEDHQNHHLSWKQRLQICIAVARGLQYLHTGLKRVLIHRCVHTSMILLDDEWSAKISSFSLSKLGPSTVSSKPLVFKKETETIVGMFGYIAPEYVSDGDLSTKSDVYSFGVVLLEILSGGRATNHFGHEISLIPWCGKNIENGSVYEIIDPFLRGKLSPESLSIFLQIADSCLAEEADERPMMGEVEMTLERALMVEEELQLQSRDNNQAATELYNYEQVASHLSDDSSNLIKTWRYQLSRIGAVGSFSSHSSSDQAETTLERALMQEEVQSRHNNHEASEFSNYEQVASQLSDYSSNLIRSRTGSSYTSDQEEIILRLVVDLTRFPFTRQVFGLGQS